MEKHSGRSDFTSRSFHVEDYSHDKISLPGKLPERRPPDRSPRRESRSYGRLEGSHLTSTLYLDPIHRMPTPCALYTRNSTQRWCRQAKRCDVENWTSQNAASSGIPSATLLAVFLALATSMALRTRRARCILHVCMHAIFKRPRSKSDNGFCTRETFDLPPGLAEHLRSFSGWHVIGCKHRMNYCGSASLSYLNRLSS